MGFRGPSYQDAIAVAQRMAQNPADSVSLVGQLVTLLANLPPPASELLSRPDFERASLWTLGTFFENVTATSSPPLRVIEMQRDVWIRGVQAQAYPLFVETGQAPADALFEQLSFFRELREYASTNGRPLFEANWRLNGKQGFISSGSTEVFAPGAVIAGDGFFSAPMDWRLQKGETLEVRVQSRMSDILPANLAGVSDANRVLRLVTVTFWAEELTAPSVQ